MHPNPSFLFLSYSRLGQKGGSQSGGCGRACSPPQNLNSSTRAGQSPAKASGPVGLGLISFLGYTSGSAALPLHLGNGPCQNLPFLPHF